MGGDDRTIGIIAGGGQFPLLVADAAREQGFRVVALAHRDETDPALSERVDEIVWIKLGQLGRLINTFKKNGVKKALMAGTITKRKMFENVMPDLKGIAVMSKLAVFHDDDILKAVAAELDRVGVEIVSSTAYLPDLIAPEGCLTRRKPTREEERDIQIGWKVAKELGRLDTGQCVVVRKKTILALEAIEGTDATILRGGTLAGEKAVVVKTSKPHQDLRFDVPAVGLGTIEAMVKVKGSVLAVEAERTLIFDKARTVSEADLHKISIVSIKNVRNNPEPLNL